MKLLNRFSCALTCTLFILITSCIEESRLDAEADLPQAIRNDFSKRYSAAEIIDVYGNTSSGWCQINFIDREQNLVSATYENETWAMAYTTIEHLCRLPVKVQQAFEQAGYVDAHTIENIYKTERAGIERPAYTIHFLYRWKDSDNVTHNITIDEDGLLLDLVGYGYIDPRMGVTYILPESHLGFIAGRYKGAEIRGYVYDMGMHHYFILHGNTVKHVFFGGEIETDYRFWRETKYEISIDTAVPENVIEALKQMDPAFTYTNLYYIESETGNAYHFENRNHKQNLGYQIGENTVVP